MFRTVTGSWTLTIWIIINILATIGIVRSETDIRDLSREAHISAGLHKQSHLLNTEFPHDTIGIRSIPLLRHWSHTICSVPTSPQQVQAQEPATHS